MTGKIVYGRLANQTTAAARVYPLQIPQAAAFPAVTYQTVSAVRLHAFGQDSNVVRARVQVDSWADSYGEVRTLADGVKTRLSRFSGVVAGITVQDTLFDNEREHVHPIENGKFRYRVSQDYFVFFEE